VYGKTMSIPDTITENYLRLVSGLGPEEVERTLALPPRDAKAALARQLVRRLHGEEAAARAEEDFDRRFRQRRRPEDIPVHRTAFPLRLTEGLVRAGLARSNGEARRLLAQNGVRVNDGLVTADLPLGPGDVVQIGKRRWVRFEVE
jgi:tyrosyl-tRNA synthetase